MTTYKVKGMHCASCAGIIEKTFKKTDGVAHAEVNYATETAKVAFDASKTSPERLSKKIEPFGYSLMLAEDHSAHAGIGQTADEKSKELADMRVKVMSILPIAAVTIAVMAWDILAQFDVAPAHSLAWSEFFHHLLPLFATYALFVVGRPYLLGVYRFFRFGKANMDTLVGIGTAAAFLFSFVVTAFEASLKPFIDTNHTYYDVTIVVIAFITLGKYLEMRSKIRTGEALQKLLNLQAKTARVIRNGKEMDVAVDQVVLGDVVVVRPAERIAVDGIVIGGASYVDESVVTGEPMPVKKTAGSMVVSGTMNTDGAFTFKATKVGADTMLARIIAMVEEAQGSRAPIQALADRISAVFVPVVLGIALVTLAAWLLVGTGYLGFPQALSHGLVAFVGVLVIACPCALGLATPTAIIVGVGKGAQAGILVKDAAALEKLYKVDTIVVDKTGTLTKGKPELVSVSAFSGTDEGKLLSILGALEKKSEHPIAHAVSAYIDAHKILPPPVDAFSAIKGLGVKGTIEGVTYFAGNARLMQSLKLPFDAASLDKETKEGKTPVVVATAQRVLGVAFVADAVKPGAAKAVARLHALEIKVVMLTGDAKNTAMFIAAQLGIDEVVAEVLPEGKLDKIKDLQSDGRIVAMAGDGVNDAPALAQADVGIAMATGTDVAIESAGITLLHGDIAKIVQAIRLSKITMSGIKQNLFWASVYNIVGIPLAAGLFFPFFGWLLNPAIAGFAMAFSSVSVVLNSLRLKTKSL